VTSEARVAYPGGRLATETTCSSGKACRGQLGRDERSSDGQSCTRHSSKTGPTVARLSAWTSRVLRGAAPMCAAASRPGSEALTSAKFRSLGERAVIDCPLVFESGQVFLWEPVPSEPSPTYLGVVGRSVVAVRAKGSPSGLAEVAVLCGPADAEAAAVHAAGEFLRADCDMRSLYSEWSAADKSMATIAERMPGHRVLRQDPWECLVSFICSSNNNIARISQLLRRVRDTFGEPLGEVGERTMRAFPRATTLAAVPEERFRELGLGYRAKYVVGTASKVVELGGDSWLEGLRSQSREEVTRALLELPGVGPKVADCVALFSLDQPGCIPVDTHVWAIACRDMDPTLRETKSLTPRVYERVGALFRDRYGPRAGWAHALLFAAELPSFRKRLPEELQASMAEFSRQERLAREERKRAPKRERQGASASPAKRHG
jgi:N-glycosylase/DNA lyase